MTVANISSNPPTLQECDEDMKVVVAPVFQGRLEESSERTRRSHSSSNWGFYQLFASTMNNGVAGAANNASSRDIVLILIYVLIGIVIFISILLIIRMLLGMASTYSSSSQRKVKVNSQSQ